MSENLVSNIAQMFFNNSKLKDIILCTKKCGVSGNNLCKFLKIKTEKKIKHDLI